MDTRDILELQIEEDDELKRVVGQCCYQDLVDVAEVSGTTPKELLRVVLRDWSQWVEKKRLAQRWGWNNHLQASMNTRMMDKMNTPRWRSPNPDGVDIEGEE